MVSPMANSFRKDWKARSGRSFGRRVGRGRAKRLDCGGFLPEKPQPRERLGLFVRYALEKLKLPIGQFCEGSRLTRRAGLAAPILGLE